MGEVELINISKKIGKKNLFEEVNISIEKGETIGIIGSNGTGKSVLFKIICGIERPTNGRVIVNGIEIGKDADFPDNIGIMINEPSFIGICSGLSNLQQLAGIRNVIDDKKIKDTMKSVGLDPDDKTQVRKYSLGMKQKLGIAQAIMEDQQILLLDEPFNALDYRTCNETKKIIKELQKEGRTIIMTSHNQNDLEELCDRMYIIDNDRIIELDESLKQKYFVM